jgi:MFS family permease
LSDHASITPPPDSQLEVAEIASPQTATGEADQAASEAEYERFIWANLRRNYAANYLHGMLGMTGFRLVNAATFVPAYLYILATQTAGALPAALRAFANPNAIVGLGLSLQQVGQVVSPIVGASQIEHRKRVLPASILMGTLMRLQVLGMAVSGWFLAGAPLLAATLFFLMLLGLFSGAQRVAFQLVLGKVIPITRRGQLQAWRNFTGGTIAAALAYAAGRYIVGNAPISRSVRLLGLHLYQNGYATTFFMAFILTSLGLTAFQLLIREPDPPRVRPRMPVAERLKSLPALLGADRGFAFFMLSQTLAVSGRIAQPFYILFAGHMLHSLSGAVIGILGLANLGADTASNLLWGYLGDRSGFRSSFLIALVLWIAGTALLMVSHAMPPIFIAFCALGAASSGYQMSSQTMVLEFGLREDMAMRLAFSSTAEGIMSSAGPLIGGLIAAAAGYMVVFSASIGCEIAALAVLVFLVEEPRLRRLRGPPAAAANPIDAR